MGNNKSSNSSSDYSTYWKNKFEKNKKSLQERKKILSEFAKKCSDLLKEKYNVREVYLIGSLARNYKIHERSDIDLVVVGLVDDKYFSALNDLYRLLPKGIDIDLVTKETASETMKLIIDKEGVII
jgi:predicted nucleotidyltransferase